jgi:hypothetical protein
MNTATLPVPSDLTNARGAGRNMVTLPPGVLPIAALADAPSPRVSSRYEFIDSRAVVEAMTAEGFYVAAAAQRRARAGGVARGVHLLDFRHPQAPTMLGTQPRILFINSHDGSRAARAVVGAFRLVCSNGLVTGTTLSTQVARHAGDAARELVERMRQLSKNTLPMFQQIERWSKTNLSAARTVEFARLATQLRWGDAERVKPEELLAVRRAGDDAGDMWTVFNRVQESTTRLSLPGVARSGRRMTTQPLQEVTASTKFNADLWRLAEEFSTL